MMDGFGNGTMGWAGWLGMSIAATLCTALIVVLAVWALRAFAPSAHRAGAALESRVRGLEDDVARLREQARLDVRDDAGSRR